MQQHFLKGDKNMGLIKCPDCQNTISDRVDSCPKCGAPLTDEDKANAQKVTKYEENTYTQHTSTHMVCCENCKNMIDANVSECPMCGVSITQSTDPLMRCEKCGNMISADVSECPVCKAASIQSKNTVSPDNEINNILDDTENKFNIKKYFVEHIELIKILAPIIAIILFLVCIVLTSRYMSVKSAKTLNADIEAITEISSDDGNKLNELQKRYDAMSDSQKSYITSYDKLEQYKSIQQAMALNSEIEEITNISSGDGDKLDELQKRYDEMSDTQKGYVTSYDKIERYKSIQQALVVKARLLNLKIQDTSDITSKLSTDEIDEFITAAQSIQEDYEKLSDSQKSYVDEKAAELYQKLDTLISGGLKMKEVIAERDRNIAQKAQQETQTNTYNTSGGIYMTMDKFNRIENGMTYRQVVEIVGTEGTVLSSSEILGVTTTMYYWYGSDGISNANIMVQDGVVISKSQFGLQ